MPDVVECAECGNRYDSETTPFCPRCGSDKGKALAGAVPMSRRDLPLRRRVQMGGVILLVLGLLLGSMGAFAALAPGTVLAGTQDELAAAEGGSVLLNLTENGTGRAFDFRFTSLQGEPLGNDTTDQNGTWEGTAPAGLFHLLVAGPENGTWNRTVLAIQDAQAQVRIDMPDDPRVQEAWVGFGPLEQVIRWVVGVGLAVLGLVMVAGGIAALKVQARGLMLAGAVAALLPAVILTAAVPLGGVLLLIPAIAAFFLILQGRRLA